jgi:two-component system, OmpR family, sensor histidine kinase BaeS
MVAFMASVFVMLSNGVVRTQFQQFAVEAVQNSASAWETQLIWYYETHNRSWAGLGNFLFYNFQLSDPRTTPEYLQVLSSDNSVVTTIQGSRDGPPQTSANVDIPLVVQGQRIGTLIIGNRGVNGLFRIERTVIRSILLVTIAGTLLTAILALGGAVWFSNRLTRPLKELLQGIHRIAGGKLEAQVETVSSDELGEVAKAFNNMAVQLIRTEEARKHLVADVAHELRTPLTIINGQLELIQQGVKSSSPESLLPIQDEVFRLTQLVNDLHQLTIAEAGKMTLNKQPTLVPQMLERIVDNFQIPSEDRGVALSFENCADNVELPLDVSRMTQVLINLIGNAVRYTPAGGSVMVRLRRATPFVDVSITDTGPGISPAHQDHIFDRFYRVDEDRTRDTGGTGLGLAIAKEFVEAHGGNIELCSTVGVGSTFTIHLPE